MLLNNPSDHYICKLFWGFGKTISMSLRTALQNVCSAKFTSYKKILKGPTESPTFLSASHPMGLFSTEIPRGRIYSTASSKWMWIWIIMIDLHAFTFSWRTLWEGEWVSSVFQESKVIGLEDTSWVSKFVIPCTLKWPHNPLVVQ